MEIEIWKDIPGYEGFYEVSNLGRVKSLGNDKTKKEKILKQNLDSTGYFIVGLRKDKKAKTIKVHQLVAMAFLNHIRCGHKLVVDHINDNQLDNRLENLQIITQRENTFKTQGNYSSKYKGVSKSKLDKKWRALIYINGKLKHLGTFTNEFDAHLAYQNKLNKLSCI